MPTADELREARFRQGLECVHCGDREVIRWGKTRSGFQRYRCKECGKTFNDRTDTVLDGLQKVEKWDGFAACMREGLSTREAARRLGIDHKTAFRWRHRVLDQLRGRRKAELTGVVEADEKYCRRSFKGSTPPNRPPRKRGGDRAIRGVGRDKVAVLHARTRSRVTVPLVIDQVSTQKLLSEFAPLLDGETVLCGDASRAMKGMASRLDLEHYWFRSADGDRKQGIYHIQGVNSYHRRLDRWMERFNGVATKYLANYMSWHVWVERVRRMRANAAREDLLGNAASLSNSDEPRCPSCGYELPQSTVALEVGGTL